jgi:glycoside/pentoside/hexuronide:cation symporter, GPH family
MTTSAPDATAMTTKPLTRREIVGYGLGDMGFNFYWTNIATFLLIFYTDVFGISAAAAATMLFVVKLINAVTDPLIGAVADRTRTRWGQFRPYLLLMSLPLAVVGVATYSSPALGDTGKLVWAYVTYLLLMTCYTAVNLPYNALSGVLSSDARDRNAINAARFIAAFAGGTLVTAATPMLVRHLGGGDDRLGWPLAMALWGAAALVMFGITFLTTTERVVPAPQQRSSVRQDLADLRANRPWILLFVLALIIMISITLRTTSSAYYFKYVVQRPDLLASFVPAYLLAAAAGAALTPVFTRFVDKRKLLIVLMTLTTLISAAFLFVRPDQTALMYALQIALGLVLGPKSPLAYSMCADAADYNEWRTGRRATAMTFAASSFAQKLGTAVAVAVIGALFTALGYVPNAAQSAESQAGIVWLMSVIPAGFAALAAVLMVFYTLDNPTMARIQADLAARRAAVA